MVIWQNRFASFSQESALTELLKRALEDSLADPDRLHQRLFFAICRDLTELAALDNSVDSIMLLDLVSDYATGEWDAKSPPRS